MIQECVGKNLKKKLAQKSLRPAPQNEVVQYLTSYSGTKNILRLKIIAVFEYFPNSRV